jgi:ornithine cyclodeaminase/alanine dehydrogenase-like protein (mu-crystallin family)
MNLRTFTDADIKTLVSMSQSIELMKEAFRQLSSDGPVVPLRTVIESREVSGRALFMPSYSPGYSLFGLKMVSVFDGNSTRELPVVQGRMLVMDANTGTPLGIFEAEYLTALRTGAASGLATDLLARKDSKVLALFGTGPQAETQFEGVLAVRPIQEVIVFGRGESGIEIFCEKIRRRGLIIRKASGLAELKNADIICTATTSARPLFEVGHISPGVHINGIGSYKPSLQEIPAEVIKKSLLVVDQRRAALSEAGDIIIPILKGIIQSTHIHGELGELVSGSKRGRTSRDEITVFKSVGNAIQDLAIAASCLRRYQAPTS